MNSTPPLPDLSNPGLLAEDDLTVRLPANGTTVTAEDLRVRLVLASDTDDGITVDASEVENVGQAVLQLLIAARAEAEADGQTFSIINPSPAFVERVAASKVATLIGLEIEGQVQ